MEVSPRRHYSEPRSFAPYSLPHVILLVGSEKEKTQVDVQREVDGGIFRPQPDAHPWFPAQAQSLASRGSRGLCCALSLGFHGLVHSRKTNLLPPLFFWLKLV